VLVTKVTDRRTDSLMKTYAALHMFSFLVGVVCERQTDGQNGV